MLTALAVTWLTMDIIGLASLLLLLVTFFCVKTLPQRNNPFLINLILTTFLATIPPCMLLIAGQQYDDPPHVLCLVQSVLMDGVAPMYGTALVMLVFHTWADLQAHLNGVTPITMRYATVKYTLLLLPYIMMISWITASTVAALQPSEDLQLSVFVYCANSSTAGALVRQNIGYFMIACGAVEIVFDVWIARITFPFFMVWRSNISTTPYYKAHIQIYVRILIFSLLQLTPILLALLETNHKWESVPFKQATQLLESMDAVAMFLVFGTQKDVLKAWKLCKSRTKHPVESDINPVGVMV